jgi:hypothetical protein
MVKKVCGKQKFFVTAGSNSTDFGNDIIADCNRVFVVGTIGGQTATDFSGKPITTLQGQRDAFVSSLDNCGHQKFFKTAGGPAIDSSSAVSISEKQVFVTGNITGQNANNFAGKPIPNLFPGVNAFVSSLDKKCGDQKFFVTTSSTLNTAFSQFVVNNEKRIFVTGIIDGTGGTKFDGEPITLVGPRNFFLAGLDQCGNEKFYKTLSTSTIPNIITFVPGVQVGLNLSCERIFTSGNFIGGDTITPSTDFNGTPLNLSTLINSYVAGFDHCGNQKFFKTSGSNLAYLATSQTIFDECVYITGVAAGTTGTDFANNIITYSGTNLDIFVAGLDKCGKQKFYVTTNGSTANEGSNNISVNSSRVFVTGNIDGNTNPRDFKGALVKTYGSFDIFVAGLNHKGIQKFYKTAGGIAFDSGSFVVSNEDAVYVTGIFSTTGTGADFRGCIIELDPTKQTTFVAKLDNCGNQEFFLTATNLGPISLFAKDEKVFLTGQLLSGTGTDFKGNEIISNGFTDIFVTRIDDLCPKPEIFRSKIPFF